MSIEHSETDLLGQLAADGLNMAAIIPVSRLESRWVEALPVFGALPLREQSLLLVGNSGPDFWVACQLARQQMAEKRDPVDRFAINATERVLHALLPDDDCRLLYPALPDMALPPCNISLQALGAMAGWHQPSPLGIGINPESGLWFAYRTLFLLDLGHISARAALGVEVVSESRPVTTSVCSECESQICISSCPATALDFGEQPDMERCVNFRVKDNSECANKCLARNACPAGAALRYNAGQIEYHYTASLNSIKRLK